MHGEAVKRLLAAVWTSALLGTASASPQDVTSARPYKESTTPPGASDAGIPVSHIVFSATKEERKAEAQIALKSGLNLLSLTVSSPLTEGTAVAHPLNLDGTANGASVELGYSRLVWQFDPNEDAVEKLCEYHSVKPCDCAAFSDAALEGQCEALLNFSKVLKIFGAKIGAGRNDFKWIDPTTLADRSERHNNWTIGVVAGIYSSSTGFWAARFDYQGTYAPADAFDVCRAIGETTAQKCLERALDPPTKKNGAIARIEWRRFFSKSRVAVNPILSRDFKNDVDSLELPIYFLQAPGNGGLNGGVSLGWRSDQKGLVAQVFIGASLPAIGK